MVIIEAVHKWGHYLAQQHFTLITDQRSVAFTFSSERCIKIKNDKIQEWNSQYLTMQLYTKLTRNMWFLMYLLEHLPVQPLLTEH